MTTREDLLSERQETFEKIATLKAQRLAIVAKHTSAMHRIDAERAALTADYTVAVALIDAERGPLDLQHRSTKAELAKTPKLGVKAQREADHQAKIEDMYQRHAKAALREDTSDFHEVGMAEMAERRSLGIDFDEYVPRKRAAIAALEALDPVGTAARLAKAAAACNELNAIVAARRAVRAEQEAQKMVPGTD
jgi:hypothetical protein